MSRVSLLSCSRPLFCTIEEQSGSTHFDEDSIARGKTVQEEASVTVCATYIHIQLIQS